MDKISYEIFTLKNTIKMKRIKILLISIVQ
jgi:hypothetical protein